MLPTENTPWPPKAWAPIQADIAEADAWYSGDEDKLAGFYGGISTSATGGRWAKFWSRLSSGTSNSDQAKRGQRLHVPAAADIAATSADLLFGEFPSFTIPDAHGETPSADAKLLEESLADLADYGSWGSVLLEAAEIGSALGGVYLRPTWDTAVDDRPMLTVVHPDRAVPVFRFGRLVQVTFWQVLPGGERGEVWRHLECHTPGMIAHGLYLGTATDLGERHNLLEHRDTKAFAGEDGTGDGTVDLATEFGITGLLAEYVPNVKPNRKHRGMPVGRSDTAGLEGLMDALDEVWSSWVREIRLGKLRILVPSDFLDKAGRGQGASFDPDQEVFSPLDVDAGANMGTAQLITPFAPTLRVADHATTALDLFERIVTGAGYSPQSFGMQGDGAAITATEVNAHSGKSDNTTARKQGYWRPALQRLAFNMLALDHKLAAGPAPMPVQVAFPDTAEADMRDTASTLNLINLAKAASTETKVRMLHPEWEEQQVAAEVARILEEDAPTVDDPTAGVV